MVIEGLLSRLLFQRVLSEGHVAGRVTPHSNMRNAQQDCFYPTF